MDLDRLRSSPVFRSIRLILTDEYLACQELFGEEEEQFLAPMSFTPQKAPMQELALQSHFVDKVMNWFLSHNYLWKLESFVFAIEFNRIIICFLYPCNGILVAVNCKLFVLQWEFFMNNFGNLDSENVEKVRWVLLLLLLLNFLYTRRSLVSFPLATLRKFQWFMNIEIRNLV